MFGTWQTARLLVDLTLVASRRPGKIRVESDVMLARARPDGILELLAAGAWRCFRFHRRFDPHEESMFVVADELPEERPEPHRG